jgi:16S rRNA (guanine527-N7)-methyltransferase
MRDHILRAIADLGLEDPERVAELSARHWQMVLAWNARTNLTTIVEAEEAAWRHYRDSLEALRVLPPGPIVDLGSGAGFPGIPLAIVDPDRPVCLVECRRKKASFLTAATARLGLKNVRVLEQRMEAPPDRQYCAAITRATFSDLNEILMAKAWVRSDNGVLIAYRSQREPIPTGARRHEYAVAGIELALDIWPFGAAEVVQPH